MDQLTGRISDFVQTASFDAIAAEVVKATKTRLVDTIGCGIGGRASDAARIALSLGAGAVPNRYAGRILGTNEYTTADTAAFANSAMSRYLDYNDTGPGSHPSDCIGAFLAIGESIGASGKRLISATIVAYEVLIRLAFGTKFRQRGWDQGFVTAVGTAAGAAHLLGLSKEKTAHAVSIAAVANLPLRASRAGQLSYWKSAATPFAVKNGLQAALLAAEGMTGPEKPFEGRFGLWEQITGPFEIESFPTEDGDYLLPRWSRLKYWPVEYNAQIAVWAALELRKRHAIHEVSDVRIETYHQAWHEIGSEEAKWHPKTRETADHSMPYIFASALRDGGITVATFDEQAIVDPEILDFMQKITIAADQVLSSEFPASIPIRVTATTREGKQVVIALSNPRGHDKNPMNESEVTAKFLNLVTPSVGAAQAADAVEAWWAIDSAETLTPALNLLSRDQSTE